MVRYHLLSFNPIVVSVIQYFYDIKVAPYSFTNLSRAEDESFSNLRALKGKQKKEQNRQWIFSRFFLWNSVKFGKLVINILLYVELVLLRNLFDHFFRSGKRHKFAKIEKNCQYKPYSFRV